MPVAINQQNFSWNRVRGLLGLPYRDSRVQELFSDVRLNARYTMARSACWNLFYASL